MSSLREVALLNATKRRFELNLAEDDDLASAMRVCEETFNADVLPRDVELMAPSDFYAAIASGPSRTRPTTRGEGARLLPYLAA